MTARTQGYLFVLITMCIWGGFTIFSRLNLHWHVSAWDLVAMRFAIAFFILMPILIYKKDLAFISIIISSFCLVRLMESIVRIGLLA